MKLRNIAAVAILSITSIVTVFILVTSTSRLVCEGQQINLALPLAAQNQIWGDNVAVQTFISPHANLNRLDIFLQTYFRRNTANITVRLVDITTYPDPLAPDVSPSFETNINAANLPAQSWQSFTFPTIADSAQKNYAIVIASPQAEAGNAITFGGIEKSDPYEVGQAIVGGTPFPGDLAFRACYQLNLTEKLAVLARQITQYRPAVWGSSSFYGSILLLYGVLIGLLFWRLAKMIA